MNKRQRKKFKSKGGYKKYDSSLIYQFFIKTNVFNNSTELETYLYDVETSKWGIFQADNVSLKIDEQEIVNYGDVKIT